MRRVELRLLQREVADRIGVDVTTIRNWELGRTDPALRYVPGIVKFLEFVLYPAPSSFGERLTLARRLLGLSRDAFAKQFGVDPSTVWRWESGRGEPAAAHHHRLKEILCLLRAPHGSP